ncbi:MAG: carbohydrate ABC transporter permease [Anaerolineales bacterium]|jgi:multiple sugar transport system permease protein|nr:carbohydrate ABC transporter permease [Anaerolineales bacterium]HUV25858.1 carbohydrate ABC transporter permease [Anaerolineales bacterium]
MKPKTKELIRKIFLNFLALLLIVFIVGPLIWVAVASIQGENDLLRKPPQVIPQNPTFDNYNYVFTGKIPTDYEVKGQLRSRISQEARLIPEALKNSFIIATAVMGINLIFGSLGAYTFSRLYFRGKVATFNFFLGSRLIPVIAVAIPYYVIIQTMGLLDTYLSLILVYLALTLPFTVWFLTLYFNGIPEDFEDAALIDGCSRFQALVRVVIPMSLPGLVAAAAFAFMTSYNEFLFARFLTQSIATQTGPVIIAAIAGNPDASYTLISVAMTLGLIPPLILALVLHRWLTEGLSTSITFR